MILFENVPQLDIHIDERTIIDDGRITHSVNYNLLFIYSRAFNN